MKKTVLLVLFLAPLCFSCGEASNSDSDYKQIIYTDEVDYDYKLIDDDRYGTAIYPNEAYRKLREIEAYNRERENTFFSDEYRSVYQYNVVELGKETDYVREEENYIPDQYYYYEEDLYFLKQNAKGFFYDDYDNPNEFYYGEYYNEVGDVTKTCEPSSVEVMKSYVQYNRHVDNHYDKFLKISHRVKNEHLVNIVNPQEIKCYSNGEGDLFINIYRTRLGHNNKTIRSINRIVYEDYRPVLTVCQTIEGIFSDEDCSYDIEMALFKYSDIEKIDLNEKFNKI